MQEIWKDIYYVDVFTEKIVDYRGIYQVSNKGNVRSLDRFLDNGRFIKGINKKQKTDRYGYKVINLYKNGKSKFITVHRLVAYMFIPNDDPINKKCINHIDEDKTNNSVSNLEWCTVEYNNNHGTRNEKVSNTQKLKGNNGNHIISIDINTKEIVKYVSAEEVERNDGFRSETINRKCKEQDKIYKNRIWFYEKDYNEFIDIDRIINISKQLKNERKQKRINKVSGINHNGIRKIAQYDLDGNLIKIWDYIQQASKELGFGQSSIVRCCKGKYKTAYGFIWKYVE